MAVEMGFNPLVSKGILPQSYENRAIFKVYLSHIRKHV